MLSDTEHDLAMQIHKHSSQEPTANPEGVSHTEMKPSSLGPGHCKEANTRPPPALSTHLPPNNFHLTHAHATFPAWVLSNPKLCPRPAPPPPNPTPRAATDPIIAKAGSSCRSKGKSIRKLVLKRAVMVTTGWKGQGHGGSVTEAIEEDPRSSALRIKVSSKPTVPSSVSFF